MGCLKLAYNKLEGSLKVAYRNPENFKNQDGSYYPFGTRLEGICSKAMGKLENKYQYAGKERQAKEFSDNSGLEWVDFGRRMYDNQIGRFFNQDRYSEKYYSLNPYQYAANNPMLFMDNNGDSLIVGGSNSAVSTFQGIANTGLGGFYTLGQSSTGRYTLNSTGQQGTMSTEQQALYNTLNESISSAGDVNFTAVDSKDAASKNVEFGDNGKSGQSATPGQHTIDVGDMSKLGSTGKLTAQGALGHEIKEGFEIQTKNLTTVKDINNAHYKDAIGAENAINGTTRVPGNAPDGGGRKTTINVLVPDKPGSAQGQIMTVTIIFKNGNIVKVKGN